MESVVKHTPGTYYLELRQDYITLCLSLTYRKSEKSKSSPHCKALILSIMEKWTNDKISKKKDPHISMTYPQWIDEMYGIFGRSVIIDSLDELIEEKLIARESYKAARGGRDQYKYLLNCELLNRSLNPTFTNQPCEEEQRLKVDDQGLQVNVATSKNKPCSSSPTFKSKPFIESDTQNHSIKSKKESTPAPITVSILSPDQQIFFEEIYCHSKIGRVPPERIDETLKKYLIRLMQYAQTVKELDSLYGYVQKKIDENDKILDKTVYPGNLANTKYLNRWLQAQEQTKQNEPEPEVVEVQQPINRENEPLPKRLCKWMIDTLKEFEEEDTGWVNELEWYYQNTTCPEKEFYLQLLQAYQEALGYQDGQRMNGLFTEFRQLLVLPSTERIAV